MEGIRWENKKKPDLATPRLVKKPRSTTHAQGPQQGCGLEQRQTHDA
jgi:hypothetical protein